tara:strand:- start:5851 stop:7242 length:1392 start_codon:yes stop_codon:yes gene_type:complete
MVWNFQDSYIDLPSIFFSKVKPDKIKNKKLVLFNHDLAKDIDLNFSNFDEKEICDILLGKKLSKNKEFFSQAYAGHQFGHFTILGDGRALLLGEHITNNNQRFDIQLKGSGKTPYSRNGDGKAALGPMIREYIVSEAMHYLGISSTRALAVIATDENIVREKIQPGAILIRVAKSHIRVGTFQFGSLVKKREKFENLISYTINRLFPELANKESKYINFFDKVCELQINLIIEWMRVGFVHGVMNTDNMSLSGETIDYGPCAYLDFYNPKTVFSSIDKMGRYRFENQPKIGLWNLARFAETFLYLIDSNESKAIRIVEEILNKYNDKFILNWNSMMSKKLNLDSNKDNADIIKEFLNIMHIHKLDYTNTFNDLENNKLDKTIFKNWTYKYNKSKKKKYNNINPTIIPRNHILEKIIYDSNNENFNLLYEFDKVIKNPYKKNINKIFTQTPSDNERVYETFCGT